VENDWSARHGFLYVAACPEEEREAAALELKAMTGTLLEGGVARSSVACDVGASAYTKIVMAVVAEAESFEELVATVADLGLRADGFAVEVHRPPPKVDVSSIDCAREIADAIAGDPNLDNPKDLAGGRREGRAVLVRARRVEGKARLARCVGAAGELFEFAAHAARASG